MTIEDDRGATIHRKFGASRYIRHDSIHDTFFFIFSKIWFCHLVLKGQEIGRF